MFANLFFLIINLLLISSTIDQTASPALAKEPGMAFILFIGSSLVLLLFIFLQSAWLHDKLHYGKERILLIVNIEFLLFLSAFYFIAGSQRWPIATFNPYGATIFSMISFFIYFTGLLTSQYAIERIHNRHAPLKNAWLSICFLLPFIIPFMLLTFISDTSELFPYANILTTLGIHEDSLLNLVLFIFLNLAIVISTLIFLPPLAVLIWHCPKLKNSELKTELDDLCRRANFKHAGLRVWRIFNNSMTAAIIGVVGMFRYILFTQNLLESVPNRAIVAVLAHEIGHSFHKHLFFYPLILMGMIITGSLASIFIFIPLMRAIHLDEYFPSLIPVLLFILFGLTMAVYFRYVFGYFSRIFERQADLHVFKLDIPASDMMEALDILAVSAGNVHDEPNWHHYGIQQRMNFLNKADKDRSLIGKHARRVRLSLAIYVILLIAFTFALGLAYS
ncbi:MAG TPA: M48 family metallopeptidase [Parachlamydiaceae bacterium]|nr:M48 family metallopeptidase [Parachlamydiaceae bacterium]